MSEIDRHAPMFPIARQAPSAVAQDEDIYLTVDFARRIIQQLSEAVEVAEKQGVC